jgi:hypothetical protein
LCHDFFGCIYNFISINPKSNFVNVGGELVGIIFLALRWELVGYSSPLRGKDRWGCNDYRRRSPSLTLPTRGREYKGEG